MQRSSERREPLYTMTEIAEKLGVTRYAISSMSRMYGAIQPEFIGAHAHHRRPQFKFSAAKKWWDSIPQDARDRALRK